ncbi:amidohydrolase [Haloplasma contractile]|uniref:N-acetylglucosamine-6-phosphate deacetylase protein n=1 Tax=Haloplasma contractile SSD-17B TaxID=1033810 RepID=U2E8I0_9MOLU|nr:amidohydrolase [Haloplasma contractile]ERJ11201.1 N-acetylglucosamine-6-phosphate deacetylase protein [Haloplasma contractile SSD-17B]
MDLIIYNANAYTMENDVEKVEAIAIKQDRIVKIGTNNEILPLKMDQTKLINAKGHTVIPGINDSHLHLYMFGYFLNMVNTEAAKSIDDVTQITKRFIEERHVSKGNWVRGRGWNQDYFADENRFPTRYDLDQISTEHPILLSRVCGHVIVVNSKALELCGIGKNPEQVEGGQIDLDEQGEPLGIFRENALQLIHNNIPVPDLDEIKETLINGIKEANRFGITSLQTDDLSHLPNQDFKLMLQAYQELAEEGNLNARIYQQSLLPTKKMLEEFLSLGYTTGWGNEYFKIGPYKILSDGSLGARTAAMMNPYHDDPSTTGIMAFTQEELDDLIMTAHKGGMHVAVHCIGDRSMYNVFSSIEKTLKNYPRDDHRHGIIHCQITDETLLKKYKELDLIAHVQPIFLDYDIHIVEDRVGDELAKTSYAFKTLYDRGVHVAYGTDCPVVTINPFTNIYSAVTRQDLKGYPKGGFNPSERVSVYDAVYQYTMGSAYASFEEENKGSIKEGKLADLTILKDDLFTIPSESIKDVTVDTTICGGKIVYKRD